MPTRNLQPSSLFSIIGAVVLGLFGMISLLGQRRDHAAGPQEPPPDSIRGEEGHA